RRCGHAQLKGRLKVGENLPPVTVVLRTAAMTLVHDDQVEELRAIIAVEPWATVILGDGLISGEIHLAAFDGLALDLPRGIAEGRELFGLWVVNENGTVGEEQNARAARLTCAVPTCAPEFPADVKRHVRLAGASSHIDQHARLAAEDGTNDTVDGDFLIVAQRLAGHWKAG